MADIESNIGINIDASSALSTLKELQRQISVFQTTMSKTGAVSSSRLADLQQNLINNINATGQFTASMQRVKTTTESFTQALEKNKLSMGQYFRYAIGSTQTFGKAFRTEFDTIDKVARERVKTLQTQYIKLGRDASGAMQAIAVRPQALDMKDLGTQTAIAAQKAQLFNQLVQQGSTNLLNFGKNTQWAGRQLMVGFTIPLGIMGAAAAREFQKIEEQVIRLERVYGDFTTTVADTEAMTSSIKELAGEFTKYGVAVEKTVGLAADAAAMGKTGADLTAQVAEANRLAVLGGVQQAQALETTISLTNAFGVSADQLSGKINFLNAVENQTVTSIEDLTEAIPKAGPVVQQLGGNVEDLAFFLTAMKEGGINASEGANALKSGLASLINPTGEAADMLAGFGINLQGIVEANKGNVKGIVIEFAKALDTLDPLNRAQAIETLFGKFQFSRMSTLFQNVIAEGTQASRVLDLTRSSAQELAMLSEKELAKIEASPLTKYQASIEQFKAALAPVGEEFMKAITPIIEFGTKILEGFNSWSDGAKQFAVIAVAAIGAVGPIVLMTIGLLMNGIANIIKGIMFVRNGFKGMGSQSQILTEQLGYMNSEQLQAAAVSASLNQVHNSLIQTFTSEAGAVRNLAAAYGQGIAAQNAFMGGTLAPRGGGKGGKTKKFARGGVVQVPGSGKGDKVPAMLEPGEAIIPTEMTERYGGLINGMIAGNIPGYQGGRGVDFAHIGPGYQVPAGDILGLKGMNIQGAVMQMIKDVAKAVPDAMFSLLHSWGAEMSGTVNRSLAKPRGATAADVGKEFSGRGTNEMFAETAKLTGFDLSDPELQKSADQYRTAMAKKIKDLQKAGVQRIVDTEAQIAALPEEQRHLFKSLEAIDKEVVADMKGQNKKFVAMRAKALATVRDVRMGEGDVTAAQRAGIMANPAAAQAVSRKTKSGGRRIWTSRQSKAAGGYGILSETETATYAAQARTAGKVAAETQMTGFVQGLSDAAQTNSPSRRTRKVAQDTVDGYVVGLESGKAEAQRAGKKTGKVAAMPYDAEGPLLPGQKRQKAPGRFRQAMGNVAGGLGGFASSGKLGMVGMGASTALMMAQGMPGPVGDIAGQVSGPLMAISSVASVMGMIPGPVGIAIGAITGLTMAGFALKQAFDDAQREAEDFAYATRGSTQAVEGLSQVTGRVTASQTMDERRSSAMQIAKPTEEQSAIVSAYMQSETGKGTLEALGTSLSGGGAKAAAADMANQMATAIAQGAITKVDADQILNEIGKQIGDTTFAMRAIANLDKIVGPNGEDLSTDPIGVRLEILGGAEKNLASAATSVGGLMNDLGEIGQTNLLNFDTPLATLNSIANLISPATLLTNTIIGGVQQLQELGTETGAFASNLVIASQQSQQMLDSLQLEYEKRIAAAKAAGDTAEAERLTTEYINGRQQLLTKNAELYKAGAEAYKTMESNAQTGVIGSLDQQIKDMYATGPQKAIAEKSIGTIGEMTTDGGTAELTLKTAVASGDIDPQTMNTVLDLVAKGGGDAQVTADLITNFGTADADRVMQFATFAEKPEQAVKFMASIENQSPEEAASILDTLDTIGKFGGEQAVKVAVSGDVAKIKALRDNIKKLDDMFANGPVTAEVVNSFIYQSTGFEMTADQQAYFNSLSPSDQKTYTTAYLTVMETIDTNTEAGRARLRQWAESSGGGKAQYYDKGNKIKGANYDYNRIAQDMAGATAKQAVISSAPAGGGGGRGYVPPPPSGGGGGGGGAAAEPEKPPTSFLDSVVKDLRDFTQATRGLTENFQDSMAAIRAASTSAFGGLSQQLRGLGLGQDVIEMMTGMSKEDWDQYKGQFFNFDAAGNVTGFKSDLTIIADKLRAVTLGKFVDEQQKSLATSADQVKGITKLVSLGMSYADAYKLVEDAALAAAIANAKSADEIRKIIALSQQAAKAQTIADASKTLANQNATNDAAVAGLNAVVRFNSALSDAQVEAILASDELQTMFANFDQLNVDQLKILKETLEDIDAKKQLEINIKMQTVEGMQDLFNEGFNKAMEQFSAKEQQIKINFQLLRNPFEDIVNSFTDQIEDIKNAPGGLDDLEADLQRIAEQETDVNEKYKKRFEALDKIQKINDRIAAQQRSQLTLADALSQGDIAAAARAAQEIRAQETAQALVDQREALSKSQELELEALRGQMNMSREQIEARIREIKQQIFEIEEKQIEPAQYQLDLLKRQEESQINSLTVLGKTKEEWDAVKNSIDVARTTSVDYEESIARADGLISSLIAGWTEIEKPKTTIYTIIEKKISDIEAAKPAPAAPAPAAPAAPAGPVKDQAWIDNMARRVIRGDFGNGQARRNALGADYQMIQDRVNQHYYGGARLFNKGGLVAAYMANGGMMNNTLFKPKGPDTIPAMLTPGEFVVKKWAVERFGIGNLQAINQGNFGSGSVYNYNMSVNVRSDANPDEIARTVMAQIKRVDSQRIRGNRF